MRRGMTAEAVCLSRPFVVIPMVVVVDVQPVIAAGRIQASDRRVDPTQTAVPGSLVTCLEAMFESGLDGVMPGSSCVVNAYTSNHERLHSEEDLGTATRIWLHAVDTVGLVHARLLRIQALVMPVQTLVLKGPEARPAPAAVFQRRAVRPVKDQLRGRCCSLRSRPIRSPG